MTNKKENNKKLIKALEETLLTLCGVFYQIASILSFMFIGAVMYAMKLEYGNYESSIVLFPLLISAWGCMVVAFMIFYKEISFSKGGKK